MKKILTFVLAALVSVATFAGTLSCAEAVEVAQGLEPNTPSEDEYIVEGYVVSVIKSSATDLRFWMADDAAAEEGTFEAWVCTGDIVNKGDKVTVTGYIQWYVNEKDESDQKAEIANGTVVVVEPAPIDENYVEFNTGDFEGKGVSSTGGEISVTRMALPYIPMAVMVMLLTSAYIRISPSLFRLTVVLYKLRSSLLMMKPAN